MNTIGQIAQSIYRVEYIETLVVYAFFHGLCSWEIFNLFVGLIGDCTTQWSCAIKVIELDTNAKEINQSHSKQHF